jgi:hypothetical protein
MRERVLSLRHKHCRINDKNAYNYAFIMKWQIR